MWNPLRERRGGKNERIEVERGRERRRGRGRENEESIESMFS